MMKHFTLIAAGIASVATLSAQRPATGGRTLPSPVRATITAEKADSNLLPNSITSGNCSNLYLIPGATTTGTDSVPGFVFGVNGLFDYMKGYRFNANGNVSGIGVATAVKLRLDTIGNGGYYRARIYSSTGAVLGVSDSVSYQNIDTVASTFPFPITAFTFPTPVAVSGDFYVMVDAWTWRAQDSIYGVSGIGMLSNGFTCGDDRSYEIYPGSQGLVLGKISAYWTVPNDTNTALRADPFIGVQVLNFLGESEMMTPSSLMAYPNPANETTVFSFHSNAEGTAQIEIRNLAGQLVSATSADVMNGRNEVSISLTNMSNGVYSYHVTVGGETKTGKLVVNH